MVVDCLICGSSGSGTVCPSCSAPLWHPDDTGARTPTSETTPLMSRRADGGRDDAAGVAPGAGGVGAEVERDEQESRPATAPPLRVRQATRGIEDAPRLPVRFGQGDVPASLLQQEPVRVGLGVLVLCCIAAGLAGFALRGPLDWRSADGGDEVAVVDGAGTQVAGPGEVAGPSVAVAVAPTPGLAYARGAVHTAVDVAGEAPRREQLARLAEEARAASSAGLEAGVAGRRAVASAHSRAADSALRELARRLERRAVEAVEVVEASPEAAEVTPPEAEAVEVAEAIEIAPTPPVPLPASALAAVREGARAGTERAMAHATRVRDTRIALDDALEALQCDRAQRLERELGELSPAARAGYRDAQAECVAARERRRGLPPRNLE